MFSDESRFYLRQKTSLAAAKERHVPATVIHVPSVAY